MGGMNEDFCDGDEDMEEDEILKRELGENTNSIAESSQKKGELRASTVDTSNITERTNSKKQAASKQGKVNGVANSSKSVKQSNLADWVSSATKTYASKPMTAPT